MKRVLFTCLVVLSCFASIGQGLKRDAKDENSTVKEKKIEIERKPYSEKPSERCKTCNGKKYVFVKCKNCNGKGYVQVLTDRTTINHNYDRQGKHKRRISNCQFCNNGKIGFKRGMVKVDCPDCSEGNEQNETR